MARRKISATGKKVNTKLSGKAWGELKASTRKRYLKQGVSPQKYNAWRKPSVRAKAKKAGVERWEYLGLPSKYKISGKSRESLNAQAYKQIELVFGDLPKFNSRGTHAWLNAISKAHVQALSTATRGEIYERAFKPDPEFADESESERKGDGGISGGYLFYH